MEDILKYIATAVIFLLFQACGLNANAQADTATVTDAFASLVFWLELARAAADFALQSGLVLAVFTGIFNVLTKFVPWLAPFRGVVLAAITKSLEGFAQARALRAVVAAEQTFQGEIKNNLLAQGDYLEQSKRTRYETALEEISKHITKNPDEAKSLLEFSVAKMNEAKNGR